MSKRRQRRERGREKEGAALRSRFPGFRILKGPPRLALDARTLKANVDFFREFEAVSAACEDALLLDLYDANFIDAAACVLLAACLQRCRMRHGRTIEVRMPRNGSARLALQAFGVVKDDNLDPDQLQQVKRWVMKVTSGMKGDPSPGQSTFEVARLAEELVADETLADRVHAALNEAADNVLSWAYGADATEPDPTKRWWIAGILMKDSASFIALDQGAGIPTTAPQNFGDALTGMVKSMIAEREWRQIKARPRDDQILLATIRQRRTLSRLEERGKGLNNMIALIDLFPSSFINIFSGDAVYGYHNGVANGGDKEYCSPLGFSFPGTLILWQLKAHASEART